VIQYIYETYGREHAALTAAIVSFRPRSAIRCVAKTFGLPDSIIDALAKSVHHWTGSKIEYEQMMQAVMRAVSASESKQSAPFAAPHTELSASVKYSTLKQIVELSRQILGFPRHISQHVGGFIISEEPLLNIVPIRRAAMEERTIIEWNKDDIEELGILKIDILALGMLSCIRKALTKINLQRMRSSGDSLNLYTIPADDSAVYDMICRADTLGVFQIESRAQMSMLPRLRPRCFYDLVIQVAIVRPGPIQGNMVHPYLRRRSGEEQPVYPDEKAKMILGKTLGVPLFQEQAMRLAIDLADFKPGEAELLRRSMAAWKTRKDILAVFEKRIVSGMMKSGYSEEFARCCFQQMKGFSEYGFPESHAASFAHLVYASAWIKHYYPEEFAAALLNSQPMGFYLPSQIVKDAQAHGVIVHSIDINKSSWESMTSRGDSVRSLTLGLHLIQGIPQLEARAIVSARDSYGKFVSLNDLLTKARRIFPRISKRCLQTLAKADAFSSLGLSRRQALWQIRRLHYAELPLYSGHFLQTSTSKVSSETSCQENAEINSYIPSLSLQQEMFEDYASTSLSLRAHPVSFIRRGLNKIGAYTSKQLAALEAKGQPIVTAGLVLFRQRPGTAKGVVFITLEDEFGVVNLVIKPKLFERSRREIISSNSLLVEGFLERSDHVIYLLAQKLRSVDHWIGPEAISSEEASKYALKMH
jgi:error-prone DNA polymerase